MTKRLLRNPNWGSDIDRALAIVKQMSGKSIDIAAKSQLTKPAPYGVELEPGKDYYYCQCGKSKTQPFCDGSHKSCDSGIKSKKFTVSEKKTYWLCGCRQSDNLPFCDGSHSKEKGIKKYNEFLLKSNTLLKAKLEDTEFQSKILGVVAGVSIAVAIAIAYLKK